MIHAEGYVEGIRAQIAALSGYPQVTKHRLLPTDEKTAIFPIVNVTWTSDHAPSSGGPRTGNPTFEHTTTLIIEVLDRANDGIDLRTKLSSHGQALLQELLTETAWGGDVLEGISQVNQQVDLPVEGNYQIGRLQITLQALSHSQWAQIATDAFLGLRPGDGSEPPIGISVDIP